MLFEVERMTIEQVRQAVGWAEIEGWEPGLSDAGPFFAADPEGFFAARLDGTLMATISAVRHSPEVAFVGFYIVEPELRGRGLGKRLWDKVLSGLSGVTLGADAVPAQIENYRSEGFEVAYGNARYSGEGLRPGSDPTAQLTPATGVDFEALVEFDGRHCFGPRPDFLRLWIEGPGREALAMTDDSGEVTAFAASRATSLGHRIGPVFAEDATTARSLILALAQRAGGRVAVDVPLPNQAAVELLESLGMQRSFDTARIYRGPAPELPLSRIFGVTSLELG